MGPNHGNPANRARLLQRLERRFLSFRGARFTFFDHAPGHPAQGGRHLLQGIQIPGVINSIAGGALKDYSSRTIAAIWPTVACCWAAGSFSTAAKTSGNFFRDKAL